MNLGRELYSNQGRKRKLILYSFAAAGILASIFIVAMIADLDAVECGTAVALAALALGIRFHLDKGNETFSLYQVCLFSLANIAILLLLIITLS